MNDESRVHNIADAFKSVADQRRLESESQVRKNKEMTEALLNGRLQDFKRLKDELTSNLRVGEADVSIAPTIRDCTVPVGSWADYQNLTFINVRFEHCDTKPIYPTNPTSSIDFRDSVLRQCSFVNIRLWCSQFDNVLFENCEFYETEFHSCNFSKCTIASCSFTWNNTLNGCFYRAKFADLNLSGVSFGRSSGLIGVDGVELDNVAHAERAQYSWRFDRCSWSTLRALGGLPLFGASYIGLVAIWGLTIVARSIEQYGIWLETKYGDSRAFTQITDIIIGSQIKFTFIAICLLAIAATLFKLCCPEEIQESSETRWSIELNQPVLRYRVLAFRFPQIRWLTLALYLVSVPWVFYLLACRIWETLRYLA